MGSIGRTLVGIGGARHDDALYKMGMKPDMKPLGSKLTEGFKPYRQYADRPDANVDPKKMVSLTSHWKQRQRNEKSQRDPKLAPLGSPWEVKKRHRDYYEGGGMYAAQDAPEKKAFYDAHPKGVWDPNDVNWAHGNQKMLKKNWSFQQFELDSGEHKKVSPTDNPQQTCTETINKGTLQRGQSISYPNEVCLSLSFRRLPSGLRSSASLRAPLD